MLGKATAPMLRVHAVLGAETLYRIPSVPTKYISIHSLFAAICAPNLYMSSNEATLETRISMFKSLHLEAWRIFWRVKEVVFPIRDVCNPALKA